MTVPSFRLDREPWIPCVRPDGRPVELGLREVLVDAHRLRAVRHPSPLVTVALLRFLLVCFHRIVDGPSDRAEWVRLWQEGRLDGAAVDAYLARIADRLDLFHPERPFHQVAGLATLTSSGQPAPPDPVARIATELASGNNATLFSHDVDDQPAPMPAAEAARQLLALQAWALGGGQGPTSNRFGKHPYAAHAPLVGHLSVWLVEEDLFRTLLANALVPSRRPFPSGPADLPAWERDEPRRPGTVRPSGYLDYLTFPARYVRLVPSPDGRTVTHAWVAQGLALPDDLPPAREPTAPHVQDDKLGVRPVGVRVDRAVWRDASAILASAATSGVGRPVALAEAAEDDIADARGPNAALRIACFGLANDKAKPLLWRDESLPATVRLLTDEERIGEVEAAVDAAQHAGKGVSRALFILANEYLKDRDPERSTDAKVVTGLADAMRTRAAFWEGLEEAFHGFLRALDGDLGVARADWIRRLEHRARTAYDRATAGGLGVGARNLRADVIGRRVLLSELKKLRSAYLPLSEVNP